MRARRAREENEEERRESDSENRAVDERVRGVESGWGQRDGRSA